MFSSRMRRVSGEWRLLWLRRRRSSDGDSTRATARDTRRRNRGSSRFSVVVNEPRCDPRGSGVAVSVSDAIERFDLLEFAVDLTELAAHALDVAVDGAVVDVDRLAVGGIHQLVAVLDVPRPLSERLQQQELGDREMHFLALPGALVAAGIEDQIAAHDAFGLGLALGRADVGAAQHGADTLEQQALGKRLADKIVGAHAQAKHLVDLLVLRRQ